MSSAASPPRRNGRRRRRPSFALARGIVIALATFGPTAALASAGTGASASRIARSNVAEFFIRSAPGAGCFMDSEPGHAIVGCYSQSRTYNRRVTMNGSGEVLVCARHVHAFEDPCELGNAGIGTPTYNAGRQITVGPFRCKVVRSGVRCTVVATGKGFYMTSDKVTSVGGASIQPAPLHLSQFLSPDRKVWCSVGTVMDVDGRSCGTEPEPPTRAAELDRDGKVRLCFVPELIYPPGGHVPEGCFQNWNYKAPVLKYGQATEERGVRCTSATNGITCITVAGPAKGKGFRINKDEAVEIG